MMIYLQQQLGLLTYPLLTCSLIAIIIVLERLVILSIATTTKRLQRDGSTLLTSHSSEHKSTREEIASFWLINCQRQLASGISLLQIIALLAPLLGLLGTVIGLIEVFDSLGKHQGPIEPAILANGLGIAMNTTAAGLIIAIPTLLSSHLFQRWIEKLIASAEKSMNLQNFQADNINIEGLK